MKVLSANQLVFDTRWTMRRHAHANYHELIVLSGGGVEVRIDAAGADVVEPVTARAGDSLLYPRGVPHAEQAVGGRPVNMICIAFEAADAVPGPVLAPDPEGRVGMLARWMTELTPPQSDEDRRTLGSLLTAALAERSARTRAEDRLVQLVRRHLRDHLAEPVSLGDLADLACLSRYHFARRFRDAAGMSPMAFVRRQRVEAARGLLMTPGVPLRWVAKMVGLRDEFHLSRVYKRVTGASPRAPLAQR